MRATCDERGVMLRKTIDIVMYTNKLNAFVPIPTDHIAELRVVMM